MSDFKWRGKLLLNLLAAISEFERDLLAERIKSGIAHARSKGTKSGLAIGRPCFDRTEAVKGLLSQGLTVRAIASKLRISKTTVMKQRSQPSPLMISGSFFVQLACP